MAKNVSVVETTTSSSSKRDADVSEAISERDCSPSTSSALLTNPETLSVFQGFVVAIGVVGLIANGFVFVVMVQIELKKQRSTNLLILNQVCLDLFSSMFLIPTYIVNLMNIYLADQWGYLVCFFIINEIFSWIGLVGSECCLVLIALERYAKIVRPISHKKYFRNWMMYVAIAVSWINGFLGTFPANVVSTMVTDGQCLFISPIPAGYPSVVYSVFVFIWQLLLPMFLLIYCYVRILQAVRRQAKIHTGNVSDIHNASNSDARIQMNLIKTMIIITVIFFISWMPNEVYYFLVNLGYTSIDSTIWSITTFFTYINVCINPVIYATQYVILNQRLKSLIFRKSEQTGLTDT